MIEWFKCPDNQVITVKDCLSRCQLGERCLTLPTLALMAQEREWKGIPSTTQLLNGTMYEFLKLTQPYVVDPNDRAFMLAGIKHHEELNIKAKELGLPSEIPLNIDRDIFDLLEPENGSFNLTDYKLWGSYRVVKALGLVEVGKKPDPSGAVYKTPGKWGKAGEPKMVSVFQPMLQEVDLFNEELQLNRYRIMLEELGIAISKMQLQVTVRDGGLAIASGRGLTRNIYRIPISRLNDSKVSTYFAGKIEALEEALRNKAWTIPCNDRECWEGARCKRYCEVAMYCPKGMLYQQVPNG
ncbi:hypothetical protein LCGC14_0599000 [marine sediment metagenome]|uniref:PD-(D/E)XK endonuclease-like domain-containing protein n=1 Tax=marine sediment metagenome TaxID=412755 RepID=A0A0F9RV31_9ZZZZ